jgi:hypothetical protein
LQFRALGDDATQLDGAFAVLLEQGVGGGPEPGHGGVQRVHGLRLGADLGCDELVGFSLAGEDYLALVREMMRETPGPVPGAAGSPAPRSCLANRDADCPSDIGTASGVKTAQRGSLTTTIFRYRLRPTAPVYS